MISNLSNSFRVLPMFNNVAVKSSFTTAHKIQLRNIHLHQPMFKSLEERLGLPAKPKRPATPYIRFVNEVRSSVQAKNPKLKGPEVISLIAKMWNSLDANKKEKFSRGIREETEAYAAKIADYKQKLSDEDVQKIKELRFEKRERKVTLEQKKKLRDLGKPKRPSSSYIRFWQKQTDRQPNESQPEFVKRMAAKWNALSDAEKAKYSTPPEEEESYRTALESWKNKMRKMGHYDVVPSESSSSAAKPTSRSRKSSVE